MTRRCTECGFECPYTEAGQHFYVRKRGYFESRCKPCSIERGKRWTVENRERKREADRQRRAAVKADPERYAVLRDYMREWKRRRKNSLPERYRTGMPLDGILVPAAALLPAVAASGVPEVTISLAAGYADSTVTKALKREAVSLEMAVRILRVLDVAPAEVGL
jgi:hypothetical protein